jgi:uncharacterized damage-inducible protein DinB
MRTQLQQQLGQLNTELDALLDQLTQYSHQQINQQPTPDSWSAMQVMHHLLLSETLSMKYCQKKLSFEPSLKKAGLMARLRAFFVRYYLLSPFKFKAPPVLATSALPAESDLEGLANQYRNQRAAFEDFLEQVPEKYLDKEVYKHPFGGRLSLSGMVDFFDAHFQHHRRQALRAVDATT